MSKYFAIYKCKRCDGEVEKKNIFVATGNVVKGITEIVDAHYCDTEEKKIGIVEIVGSDI